MAEEMMTPVEAAAYLHLSVDSVTRKARQGRLPAVKAGRKWLFRKADLEAWLAEGGDLSETAINRWLIEQSEAGLADPDEPRIPWEQIKAERGW